MLVRWFIPQLCLFQMRVLQGTAKHFPWFMLCCQCTTFFFFFSLLLFFIQDKKSDIPLHRVAQHNILFGQFQQHRIVEKLVDTDILTQSLHEEKMANFSPGENKRLTKRYLCFLSQVAVQLVHLMPLRAGLVRQGERIKDGWGGEIPSQYCLRNFVFSSLVSLANLTVQYHGQSVAGSDERNYLQWDGQNSHGLYSHHCKGECPVCAAFESVTFIVPHASKLFASEGWGAQLEGRGARFSSKAPKHILTTAQYKVALSRTNIWESRQISCGGFVHIRMKIFTFLRRVFIMNSLANEDASCGSSGRITMLLSKGSPGTIWKQSCTWS